MKLAHTRLKGFRAVNRSLLAIPPPLANDFNQIIQVLVSEVGSEFSDYALPVGSGYVQMAIFATKLEQVLSHLELVDPEEDSAVEAGARYNSIADGELKLRVSDLLSAKGKFDRAINQATQVLEDRIRQKANASPGLTGTDLVNKMIKSDPATSTLMLSLNNSEQEGMASLCRGMMMSHRNETHHQLTNRYKREDALKVCAFVDLLLRAIDDAMVRKP